MEKLTLEQIVKTIQYFHQVVAEEELEAYDREEEDRDAPRWWYGG